MGAGPKCFLCFCCCNCVCCRGSMANKMLEKNKLESEDADKYMAMIDERLNSTTFLSGDSVGILDLSLYGMTHTFA